MTCFVCFNSDNTLVQQDIKKTKTWQLYKKIKKHDNYLFVIIIIIYLFIYLYILLILISTNLFVLVAEAKF